MCGVAGEGWSKSSSDSRGGASAAMAGLAAAGCVVAASYTTLAQLAADSDSDEPPIHKIVLTGGPCAGKSSALSDLRQRLSSLGWAVYAVPEVATLMITGGTSFADVTQDELLAIEKEFMKNQFRLEEAFVEVARSKGKKAVIICDRGTMDMAAYMPAELWEVMLEELNATTREMRDSRYTSVVHMVTAADGAEKFYTTANNAARTETPAQAREGDKKLREAWVGAPNHVIVDNSGTFKFKIQRVVDAICRTIGEPAPTDRIRRFVIGANAERGATLAKTNQLWPDNIPYQQFNVCVTMLKETETGAQVRLVAREQDGARTFTYSVKRMPRSGVSAVVARPLSTRDYYSLRKQKDATQREVRRVERCFVYGKRVYTLQEQEVRGKPMLLLKAEDDSGAAIDAVVPPFLRDEFGVNEVTGDNSYTTEGMAVLD